MIFQKKIQNYPRIGCSSGFGTAVNVCQQGLAGHPTTEKNTGPIFVNNFFVV